ncbi:MAG: SBBP repeat-containing protein [Candidatus Brocadiaceae bacterium]|nr:SBBP repeat-containing protein [Candidatus Brocadiaceae bacterium]
MKRRIKGSVIPVVLFLLMFLVQNIPAEQNCVREPLPNPLPPQSEMNNSSDKKTDILQNIQNLQIPFIVNEGQSAERVMFYANTFGGTIFITKDGEIVYSLRKRVRDRWQEEMGYGPRISENGMQSNPKVLDLFFISWNDPISYTVFPDTDYTISSFQISEPRPEICNVKSRVKADVLNEVNSSRPLRERERMRGVTLKEAFMNGKISGIQGRGKAETKANYFRGSDPSQWKTNISMYNMVTLREVYEGIDLRLKAYGNTVEKLFYVKSGADPNQIKIRLSGIESLDLQKKSEAASSSSKGDYYGNSSLKSVARGLSVNEHGELEVETEIGTVKFTKPVAFQEVNGKRMEIAVEYSIQHPEVRSQNKERNLISSKSTIKNSKSEYGFKVASYDRTKDLVIDPAITYSTYLGGDFSDVGRDIAVDGAGNAYVTGETVSPDFPTVNAMYENLDDSLDAFVTKIDASGAFLLYSTYLGGNDSDIGRGIAIDDAGNAYVTGRTKSPDFPTANAIDGNYDCYGDAFVTKIDASGAFLSYSTYLGGNSWDYGYGVAVDSAGNAYVTGYTDSPDFPAVNAIYGSLNSYTDAFVTKIDASGASLSYSTYLGGKFSDWGRGISVDSAGNAYVTGETVSPDFPTINAIYGSINGPETEAFVTKIDASGACLSYSTYLGGNGEDSGRGIAVDSAGNAYVTGYTSSPDFPTANAIDGSLDGALDAFVTKIDASGTSLSYSTYLGGNGNESAAGIAVDSAGNAYVTGYTASSDFPMANAVDGNHNGGYYDCFVTKIDASGARLSYSTYLGGNGEDYGAGIAVDGAGNVYVTGDTDSPDFPAANAIYGTYNGGRRDAFVVKIARNTLKAFYKFNEGSGIDAVDSSGNGNDGTINGAMWSTGWSGGGLDFDGTDDSVDFCTNLGITGELTVSAWVYPTAAPNGKGRVIASTFDWDCDVAKKRGWTLGLNWGSNDRLQFQVFASSGQVARANLNNFFADNLNQWTHVVGVFSPSQYARIYVNGVMVAEHATSIPAVIAYQTGINLRLGARADSNAGRWQGGIDEVRIYDRALSYLEILDLYNGL